MTFIIICHSEFISESVFVIDPETSSGWHLRWYVIPNSFRNLFCYRSWNKFRMTFMMICHSDPEINSELALNLFQGRHYLIQNLFFIV